MKMTLPMSMIAMFLIIATPARLHAVSIPGEANTLPAAITAEAARAVGMAAVEAGSVAEALAEIAATSPEARVLICGSLYLAGSVLRENG